MGRPHVYQDIYVQGYREGVLHLDVISNLILVGENTRSRLRICQNTSLVMGHSNACIRAQDIILNVFIKVLFVFVIQ